MTGRSPVSPKAEQQTVVALSTVEAEYVAASLATCEALHLHLLHLALLNSTVPELKPLNSPTTPMFINNEGALKLIIHGPIKARTHHVDLRYRHIIDEARKQHVRFIHVRFINPAGIMTKASMAKLHEVVMKLLLLVALSTT